MTKQEKIEKLADLLPAVLNATINGVNQDFYLAIWKHKKNDGWDIFYGGEEYALHTETDKTLGGAMRKMTSYVENYKTLTNQ